MIVEWKFGFVEGYCLRVEESVCMLMVAECESNNRPSIEWSSAEVGEVQRRIEGVI